MNIKKGENSQFFGEITIKASPPIYKKQGKSCTVLCVVLFFNYKDDKDRHLQGVEELLPGNLAVLLCS